MNRELLRDVRRIPAFGFRRRFQPEVIMVALTGFFFLALGILGALVANR